MQSRRRRAAFLLLNLVLALALGLAAAEVALRALAGEGRAYPYAPSTMRVFQADAAITPGITGPSRFTTNSLGCRGPEPAGERVRLLTVGGSTTACTQLDDDEAWPALLALEVNAALGPPPRLWVTNSGLDGRNLGHHLAHARLLVPRLPDIDLVLLYAGLNDCLAWLYDERPFDPAALDDPATWSDVVARSFKDSDFVGSAEPWHRRSALLRRLRRIATASRTGIGRAQGGGIEQDEHGRWLVTMRLRKRTVPHVPLSPARRAEAPVVIETYGRRLAAFADAVRAAGAEPVFMAQAIRWTKATPEERDLLWMGLMDDGKVNIRDDELEALLERFNARMRAVAEEKGIAFIDLPAALEGVPGLFFDGTHFTERGAREVAKVVARSVTPLVGARAAR